MIRKYLVYDNLRPSLFQANVFKFPSLFIHIEDSEIICYQTDIDIQYFYDKQDFR